MASIGTPTDTATIVVKGERLLCIKYERPALTPSGLHIPEPFRVDPFWAYWEVVQAPEAACRRLGYTVQAGDIIRTPFRPAIDTGLEDTAGKRLFIVACGVEKWDPARRKMVKEGNVTGIIPNTWDAGS